MAKMFALLGSFIGCAVAAPQLLGTQLGGSFVGNPGIGGAFGGQQFGGGLVGQPGIGGGLIGGTNTGPATGTGTGIANGGPSSFNSAVGLGAAVQSPLGSNSFSNGQANTFGGK